MLGSAFASGAAPSGAFAEGSVLTLPTPRFGGVGVTGLAESLPAARFGVAGAAAAFLRRASTMAAGAPLALARSYCSCGVDGGICALTSGEMWILPTARGA